MKQFKTLATFHPAYLLYEGRWQDRPIVVADLIKAFRESETMEISRPHRLILIDPTLREIEQWIRDTLTMPVAYLGVDIETQWQQIKMISFARSPTEALVVPLLDETKPGASYWPSREIEFKVWKQIQLLLESPVPKVFQNGMYDLQYLIRAGLRPRRVCEDTMLLHHSVWPELPKSLGFLGSIYTNETSWKLMRAHTRHDTGEKRDE